jgi:glutathione S-transferase
MAASFKRGSGENEEGLMKLIGSYTSPYVRKISVMLLEKGIPFDFINDTPHEPGCKITQYNPLGKVPALVADDGEIFYDSPIIVQFIELMNVAPTLLPWQPLEALRVKQIEALADGVTDAAVALVLEGRTLLNSESLNVADIAVACCLGYLNFRRIAPGWCVEHPELVKLVERLFQRESFARTTPPGSGNASFAAKKV